MDSMRFGKSFYFWLPWGRGRGDGSVRKGAIFSSPILALLIDIPIRLLTVSSLQQNVELLKSVNLSDYYNK